MKSIKEIAEMLRDEGYEVIECKINDEDSLQIYHKDSNFDYEITYIRNVFFNKNNNVSEMSITFLGICNESLFKEIKKTSKKIKNLIKEFNQKG